MKKTKLFLLAGLTLLMFSFSNAEAKNDVFAKGDNNINFQLGLGNWFYSSFYHTSIPQVSVSFDHGLRDDWGPGVFGVGAFVSFARYRYGWGGFSGYGDFKITSFNVAGRATYHYQFVDKLDTYGGAIIGVNIRSDNVDYYNSGGVSLMGSAFVGIKYYVKDNLSLMSELYAGSSVAFFNLGIGLKF
jgi:hypothetical protein